MSVDYGLVATVGTDDVSENNLNFSPIKGFNGTSSDDDIYLGDDNNVALGGLGDDVIYGGTGDDAIDGGAGDDIIYPGQGEDSLTGVDGENSILDFSAEDSYSFMTADGIVLSSNELIESKNSVGEIVIEASDGTAFTFTNTTQTTNSIPNGSIVVFGVTIVGQTLQADASSISDADGIGSFSYQWFRDYVEINGATSSVYVLTLADVGTSIYAVVSYTDGADNLETISSSPTEKVQPANDDEAITESLGAISAINTGSGSNMVLEFYADESLVGASVMSFDAVVTFDTAAASYASVEIETGYFGFPNEADGVINLSGISLSGVSSSDPLFTLNFTDLDVSEDFAVYVSDVMVNGTSLEGSTLLIGEPDTFDVSTQVATRDGSKMSDVAIAFNDGNETTTVLSGNDGVSMASITTGSDVTVSGSLDYDISTKSINSQDALDALRLSVGMDTQSGTSAAFDYIAADFN